MSAVVIGLVVVKRRQRAWSQLFLKTRVQTELITFHHSNE